MSVALNVAVFQAGWFACVLGAAHGLPWIGIALTSAAVAWHAWRAPSPARELELVAIVVLIGAIWDSALVAAGWIAFAPEAFAERLAPYWILALWALFATTLNVSLRWLRNRPVLAALLGALSGPLAYWAGARLGALELRQTAAIAALAFGWAAILPGLLGLAERLDGMRGSPA